VVVDVLAVRRQAARGGDGTHEQARPGIDHGLPVFERGERHDAKRGSFANRRTVDERGTRPRPWSEGRVRSRTADGRAVLRSSVREFLCSEAMYHLGVPTTRALSLVLTGEHVVRDMFYDGRPKAEPGAVVCRVAPSFLRFGSFEIFASRQDEDTLRQLLDYAGRHHFPDCVDESGAVDVGALFEKVCVRTAHLVAAWMSLGFVHGVMNTDNMSLVGLTIDYGPYGWLDDFDPEWTPNTSDAAGRRYRFRFQPRIALWNLVRLAEALSPVVANTSVLERGLDRFQSEYRRCVSERLHRKLGLTPVEAGTADEAGRDNAFGVAVGDPLIDDLGAALSATELDMTLFFRRLSRVGPEHVDASEPQLIGLLEPALYSALHQVSDQAKSDLCSWLRRYATQLSKRALVDREQVMHAANPAFILRNYLAQDAIEGLEQGDDTRFRELLSALRRPYEETGDTRLQGRRPNWARHKPGGSSLSCSSLYGFGWPDCIGN